jgi:hypothetical protein
MIWDKTDLLYLDKDIANYDGTNLPNGTKAE